MIHLKTRHKPGVERRFAVLIEPDPDGFVFSPKASPEDNDKELHEYCEKHGEVRIWEFEESNPFQLKRNYTTLTPEQFKAEWIGD